MAKNFWPDTTPFYTLLSLRMICESNMYVLNIYSTHASLSTSGHVTCISMVYLHVCMTVSESSKHLDEAMHEGWVC